MRNVYAVKILAPELLGVKLQCSLPSKWLEILPDYLCNAYLVSPRMIGSLAKPSVEGVL